MNAEIRKQARMALAGRWKILMVIGIMAAIISQGIPETLFKVMIGQDSLEVLLNTELLDSMSVHEIEMLSNSLLKPIFIVFVSMFLLSPFNTSFTWIILDNVRKNPIEQKQLMQNITPYYGSLVFYNILYFVYIVLWSLLFVVPGIIKLHSYALAPYILKDNPQMSPNQAITESRKLMDGRKFDLFRLAISFIGWFILTQIILAQGANLIDPLFKQNFNLYLILLPLWQIISFIAFWVYFKSALAIFYLKVINQDQSTDDIEQVKESNKQPTNIII